MKETAQPAWPPAAFPKACPTVGDLATIHWDDDVTSVSFRLFNGDTGYTYLCGDIPAKNIAERFKAMDDILWAVWVFLDTFPDTAQPVFKMTARRR